MRLQAPTDELGFCCRPPRGPPVSRARRLRLHHGLVAGGALTAIVLLVIFYSVVTGAVTHASLRRTATASAAVEVKGIRLPTRREDRSFLVSGLAD